MENTIPDWLLSDIKNGNTILFLGAGATIGASSTTGQDPVNGNQLRDILCDEYLGGELKDKSLSRVAELAKNGVGLKRVQQKITSLFSHLAPAPFHIKIPTFKWQAIFTTNYDTIIEKSYEQQKSSLQKPLVLAKNTSNLEKKLSAGGVVPIIKLHGCINHDNDDEIPFILASEEYAKHRNNRDQLFSLLSEWGRDYSIIFCGYDIEDPNIQQILFDLGDNSISRPSYVVARPGLHSAEISYWKSRRFIVFNDSFEKLIEYLDQNIDAEKRKLSMARNSGGISLNNGLDKLDKDTQDYINENVDYIYKALPCNKVPPEKFYRGLDDSWGAFSEDLDSHRNITDQLLIDIALDEKPDKPELYLLKGYAGSGKTVILKRFSWSSAHDYQRKILYIRPGSFVNPLLLINACEAIEDPIVVVDELYQNIEEINELIRLAEAKKTNIQVLTSARSNEWNIFGENLSSPIKAEYEVGHLTHHEIETLISKLKEKKQLEQNLLTEERVKELFTKFAHNLLLVGLYEAIDNGSLSDIVLDEYEKISSEEAKMIYRDIATLNQFRVPVRAGLISRINNINFTEFSQKLILPLEKVVKVEFSSKHRDHIYETRHPIIAENLFMQVFNEEEKKSSQIVRVIKSLNPAFQSDEEAISQLIRGKTLSQSFRNKHFVKNIYDAALENPLIEKSYIYHQMAVFELRHAGCDLSAAYSYICTSEDNAEEGRVSSAILHTKANIFRRRANASQLPPEKDKFRNEAKTILKGIINSRFGSPSISLLSNIYTDEISDELSKENSSESLIQELIKIVQDLIESGSQRFPSDQHIDEAEANLNKALGKDKKAIDIMERAVSKSGHEPSVTMRYTKLLKKAAPDQTDKIENFLKQSLSHYPMNKLINFELGHFYSKFDEEEKIKLSETHFKRSYSEGDERYLARFWHARQLYLLEKKEEAKSIFDYLSVARVSPEKKYEIVAPIKESGRTTFFPGSIHSTHDSFLFVQIDNLNDLIFCHHSIIKNCDKSKIAKGEKVKCEVGFNFKGPAVKNITFTR
ncbi:SIR2 family NAD-dependent protein deacylase [Alcanivorax sediminis]|uniref:Novel STAND NTPase 5 domain-containing protein n=1 Tax=Alcanivorax sediminis TaxID=2663008 RepID=A0A6N7LRS9_9GAMM|nr:SIR2 family protein [Alcanivorax sediminis]MQX51976.1 hypothetical protein [Alcanivorax sediminis]